ncbi:MAG: insulinase family protein [Bacteroidetes bacterium SB0662_bin_6]|nr:insulinase family protein [Bacteroidetes bacterium SB0668_bin_1]MYE04556.1 insulinase family protein [Bacteroidetes bacterium SB0662_bin_6]
MRLHTNHPTTPFPGTPVSSTQSRDAMTRSVYRILTACIVAALCTLPAFAQSHYADIDTPPLPEFDIPEPEQVTLPNGMIVFLIENHELPLISMSARVGAGAVYEPAGKVGLASIAGQVMRTGGTENVDADALNLRLENMGAQIEASIGTVSGQVFMSSLTETVDEVLPLFADVVMHPAFPQDKIDLAKTQAKSGISRRNDEAQSIVNREFDKLVYGADSPYARHTEYATIDAIERQDLIDFHGEYFLPNNTILGVWGDFDTAEMVAKLESAFAAWQAQEDFVRPTQPIPDTGSEYGVYYAPKADVTQSTILMGHPGEITMNHPDYFAVTVMNQVLSGFTGRLFQNVRDDKGLAYAVFGAYTANFERPGQFYAGIMTKSESTVDGTEAVREEIEKMRAAPPSEEELQLAKDNYLNSFVFNFDTRQEIVNRMMTYAYYDYPLDFLNQVREGVQAVDASEVHRVAQKYLRPDDMKIIAVGNGDDFGRPLTDLGEVETIDITIPTGLEPAPEATEETLSEGQELFEKAVDTLGGREAFAAIKTLRQALTTAGSTPDGQQFEVEMMQYVAYPDRVRLEMNQPGLGPITIVVNGDDIMLDTPQGVMPAPPMVSEPIKAQIDRDIISILGRDDLTVQHLGLEELEGGQTVDVLSITVPGMANPIQLLLDPDTHEPVGVRYSEGPVQALALITEMQEVGGVRLPSRLETYMDGAPAGSTELETEINVELPDHLFELEASTGSF